MSKISIVIPCFNEEEALPVYYREMRRVMEEMSEEEFELLFVDDGSSDRTLPILKEMNAATCLFPGISGKRRRSMQVLRMPKEITWRQWM